MSCSKPHCSHEAGFAVWLTGLSGSGKTTIAHLLAARTRACGIRTEILDGDSLRSSLCRDLAFSKPDRDENVGRIAFVAQLLARNGVAVIVAAISPYRAARQAARAGIQHFVEVHVDCPIETLGRRDVKGLYRRAMTGEIPHFTGVSDPYEAPLNPDVSVSSGIETPEASAEKIFASLLTRGLVLNHGCAGTDLENCAPVFAGLQPSQKGVQNADV